MRANSAFSRTTRNGQARLQKKIWRIHEGWRWLDWIGAAKKTNIKLGTRKKV